MNVWKISENSLTIPYSVVNIYESSHIVLRLSRVTYCLLFILRSVSFKRGSHVVLFRITYNVKVTADDNGYLKCKQYLFARHYLRETIRFVWSSYYLII